MLTRSVRNCPVQRVPREVRRFHQEADLNDTAFNMHSFLESIGLGRKVCKFKTNETIFRQGDPAKYIMYIQEGGVKRTVVNESGKEVVVAILGPGDFFGEKCLTGQPDCMASATTIAPTTVLMIEKQKMIRTLHAVHEFSDRFLAYMLARNIRVEADLTDQLFNCSEKRLARTLLLLSRFDTESHSQKALPNVSQETLADMVGTTRGRINFFMNKFRKLGLIDYDGQIRINRSLLKAVLHDEQFKLRSIRKPPLSPGKSRNRTNGLQCSIHSEKVSSCGQT